MALLLVLLFRGMVAHITSESCFRLRSRSRHTPQLVSLLPISLVVPGTVRETECLADFVSMLALSPSQPFELIIVMSEIGERTQAQVSKIRHIERLAKASLRSNVRLFFREGRHWQHANRNFGAAVSTQPLISFMDIDDLPHPRRLDIIFKLFSLHSDLSLLLHKFVEFSSSCPRIHDINESMGLFFSYKTVKDAYTAFRRSDPCGLKDCCTFISEKFGIAHNAWGTMRREVWEAVPQRPLFRVEDSMHNTDIAAMGYNVSATQLPLGYYRQRVNGLRVCGQVAHALVGNMVDLGN